VTARRGEQVVAVSSAAYEGLRDALERRGLIAQVNGTTALARCPAHDDGTPSLSVTGIEGQVLVYCHGGYATVDVLAALDLTVIDLFDTRRGATYRYDNGRTVHRTPDKRFRQANTDRPVELYSLGKVKAAVTAGRPVFIAEGEKDVHALESIGVTATCAPLGAGKWAKVDPSPLYGGNVLIIADQDDAGRRHALDVLASLRGKARAAIFAPKVGKDAADHIAAGRSVREFVPVSSPIVDGGNSPLGADAYCDDDARPGAITVRLANVQPEHVDWLWRDRLPLGKIVVLDGDPSVGKSTLAVDMGVRVSTGSP
jgi:hypothetical protein